MQLRTSLQRYLLLTLSGPLVLINPVSAKSTATDSAATTLEQLGSQWLNQWGRAEINLTGNTSKTLQGGGALLFPLLSGEQQLLFTQIGGHFGKTGNLLNTGMGQRWFTGQGYWGYHLFHDCHFKKHQQRLSLGLEWQHNNLSIALNGYQPLTNKQLTVDTAESKSFERPARGFDLRCQYRLPQHPQLRLNLTGERYLGKIVHNDSIVHNRSAVTVGFDYTPIPLITAGYGFNRDNAYNNAHQLQLTLIYRLGVPLAEQFDPQPVHIARSSLSNRLDLVRRNHQIVLQQLVRPKIKENNTGSPPPNPLSAGTQGSEGDPKNILLIGSQEEDNNSEIVDEQQRNAEAKKNAVLTSHLPNYGNSDAEIAAEQQKRNTRAEARENAALARHLSNYKNSDAEIAAEQQKRNTRAEARENAALARHLSNYKNSDAEIAAEQQKRNTRAEARENAALARHLSNYKNSDAEIAAEQQKRNTRAEARENAALARHLSNYKNSDAEIAAEQQKRNTRAEARENAALACHLSDYKNSDAEMTTEQQRLNARAYAKDGETSALDTDRQSEPFYTELNSYLDSDFKIAPTSDTSTSITSSTLAISPGSTHVAISGDQGRMSPIEKKNKNKVKNNRQLTESQLDQTKTLRNQGHSVAVIARKLKIKTRARELIDEFSRNCC